MVQIDFLWFPQHGPAGLMGNHNVWINKFNSVSISITHVKVVKLKKKNLLKHLNMNLMVLKYSQSSLSISSLPLTHCRRPPSQLTPALWKVQPFTRRLCFWGKHDSHHVAEGHVHSASAAVRDQCKSSDQQRSLCRQ